MISQHRFGISLLLAVLAQTASAQTEPIRVEVQAGDIEATAIGADARTSINLGAIPGSFKQGCARVKVETGTIRRTAIGPNAKASVELPEPPSHCQENSP